MKLKARYFGFFLLSSLAMLSCKEAAEGVDQTADHLTGKNQIEKKKQIETDLKNINQQHNTQLEEATKDN